MRRRTNPPVVLADGFTLSESLGVPCLVAYKQSREENGYSHKVFVERIDEQGGREVFDENRHSQNCPLAWSTDGRTLYHSHDQIFAIDVELATARALTNFQNGESANWHLSCSSDNKTLAFLDFPPPDQETGKPAPHRLCTIGTDGKDFRVVLDQPEGYRIWQVDVSWRTRQGVVCGVIPHQGTGFWKIALDGGKPIRCGQVLPGAYDFRLSPDGEQVVYSDHSDGGLHILSLGDGQSRRISRSGTNPSWSPDGKQIAFMYGDHELWMVSLEDGEFQRLVWFGGRNYFPHSKPGRGSYAQTPLWSPDGRFLWFRLTKSHRLRNVKNPEFLQDLKKTIDAGERHFGAMSVTERQRSYEASAEMQRWDYQHKHGFIDLMEKRVMMRDGYWTNVAWGPVSGGAK